MYMVTTSLMNILNFLKFNENFMKFNENGNFLNFLKILKSYEHFEIFLKFQEFSLIDDEVRVF